MLNVQINPLVSLQMDTERPVSGIADGIAVLETKGMGSRFTCPFRLVINSDEDITVEPTDILHSVEQALAEQGLGVKVAAIRVATK